METKQPNFLQSRNSSCRDSNRGPFSRMKGYLTMATVLTELPSPSPTPTPTRPAHRAQGAGHPQPPILSQCGGAPRGGVRTSQCLGFPYHLVFIFLLSLCFGPWNFKSCPFKEFIVIIPRKSEGKKEKILSLKCCCSCSRPQCPQALE